jgi:DNA-binding transcriptional ArsR family regulator
LSQFAGEIQRQHSTNGRTRIATHQLTASRSQSKVPDMPKPLAAGDHLSMKIRAIADPTRRQILQMLREKGQCSLDKPIGMCASDVEQRLSLAQPTVSHHLRLLKTAGLVETKKIGQWIWFRRNESALRELLKSMKDEI